MSTLLYNSATDIKVTRNDLAFMPTPPALGSRHKPYSFADFTNKVVSSIERHGLAVKDEDFAITKDGMRLFGLINVRKPCTDVIPFGSNVAPNKAPWNLVIGLRGSHDQKISRGIALGSQVLVCSNLCFHGNLGNWATRQTTNIDDRIPALIDDAIGQIQPAFSSLTVDFDRFNSTRISRDQGDNLLVSIFRAGGFSSSQLGRAINEWETSSIAEHSQNGRNIWWLFNAATQSLKPNGANSNHNDLQDRSTIIFNHLNDTVRARAIVH